MLEIVTGEASKGCKNKIQRQNNKNYEYICTNKEV